MIPVADPFMADVRPTGLQRGRGGFLRAANDTPWVTHPDGTIVATGPRKGEPLRVPYAQPSGAGRLIENDVGLTKYKQRNTLLGIGMSVELREACIDLAVLEAGSDEFRKAADTIVVEADNLTRSWLAADRGSHGHLICELFDRDPSLRFFDPEFIAAGEALGLDVDTQFAVSEAWEVMLHDNGLEILAIEASCVDDLWRLAGTLDRIVRCTRELRFARPDGTIITIPASTVLILDIKFGQIRRAHLIQCASYAQSVPYDTVTEQRGVWPWEISSDHALIAHGDFGGDGTPVSFELVWIDLAAGREHGGQCVADAKTWSARDDLWSVAQLDVEGDVTESPTIVGPTSPSTPVSPAAPMSAAVNAGAVGSSADQPPHPPAGFVVTGQPGVVLVDRSTLITTEALAWASQPAPTPLAPLPTNPDEGKRTGDFLGLFTSLEARYHDLDAPARKWIARLVSEATQANVGFHVQSNKTQRRWHIIHGLVSLTKGDYSDDVLRALCVAALDNDAPLDPRHTPGACVGSLDAAAAQRFATLVDEYVANPQDLATPVA